ncbi:hypothetical protein EST38_g3146 [Candolleomyces aberdarensis]|uniref:Uncharacterized protein n=1 Tax=Candolleomyces aberdarensis TaxID=2316362 RepID=A0A4Q2DTT9_9AGAR|nr:hypothetical protein EST38_g3146 [Candolleomyces aberdarensis]
MNERRGLEVHLACFAAKGAWELIETKRPEIIQALDLFKTPVAVLAGFNEAFVKRGQGLIQEVHIFPSEESVLEESTLAQIGRVTAPYPCAIVFPSGKILRAPLYDAAGVPIPTETMLASSVFCEWRVQDAMSKGLCIGSSRQIIARSDGTGGSRTGDGQAPSGVQAESDGVGETAVGGESVAFNRQGSQGDGRGEHAEAEVVEEESGATEGRAETADGPPGPEGGSRSYGTQGMRKARLELTTRINPGDSGFTQDLQMTCELKYHFTPKESAGVQFTTLICEVPSASSRDHPYSQSFLKVRIDTGDLRWRIEDSILPKSTRAAEGSEERVDTFTKALNWVAKSLLSVNFLSSSASVEAAYGRERSNMSDRIQLRRHRGVCEWLYHVDDENMKPRGIDLDESKLPQVDFGYRKSDDPEKNQLKVDISSIWSLQNPLSSESKVAHRYSNLCQAVSFDLASVQVDDDCVATHIVRETMDEDNGKF